MRHWRLGSMAALAVVLLTLWTILALPCRYRSESHLLVHFGSETAALDSGTATGQLAAVNEMRENEIQSLVKVLTGRAILDRLVESLGPEYVLTGRGEEKPAAPTAAASPLTPIAAHEQAVRRLAKLVNISSLRDRNIISVQCEAASPEAAQKLTASLVEICLDESVNVLQTDASDALFAEQREHSKLEWEAAATRLSQEKDKLGAVTIEGKRAQLQDEIDDIDAKLMANRSDLATAETRMASLEKLIASLPKTPATTELQTPNAVQSSAPDAILQLEAREQELTATRGDDHPQLLDVRRQLAELRQAIVAQPLVKTQTGEGAAAEAGEVNPSRRALELNLQGERTKMAALLSRQLELTALAGKLRSDLEEFKDQAASLGQLQQDVDLAESRYMAHADKLDEAPPSNALKKQRITGLTVIQPATFPIEPTGHQPAWVLALGLGLATTSGLGTALLAARFQPILTTPTDLVRLWDVPLVGVVPRVEPCLAAAT